jgi:hypothetical protein
MVWTNHDMWLLYSYVNHQIYITLFLLKIVLTRFQHGKNHVFGLCSSSYSFLKNTTFRKLDLFPSSAKIMAALTLLGPLERASLNHLNPVTEGPNRVGATIILPQEGNILILKCFVFLRNIRRWTKSKNMILSSTIHYRQNRLQ